MVPRRRTAASTVKPALNAGLTLYVGDRVENDWIRLMLTEKEIEGARVTRIVPGKLNEDFALLNPTLSVPTLADREGVLSNASIIAEYLDERYPHPRLMPASPSERARMRLALIHICAETFPLVPPLPGQPFPTALRKLLVETLEPAAHQIGTKRWFMGFDFNLVDCAWAVILRRARPEELKDLPATKAYAQRLAARPAFRRCFGEGV
jgi:RNA polymerase-associated protein